MNRPRCRIRSRILWCLALAYLLTFTALLLFLQRGSPRQQTNSAIHHMRSEIHRHDNDDASPLLSTSRSYKSDSPACHPHFLSFSSTLQSSPASTSTTLDRFKVHHVMFCAHSLRQGLSFSSLTAIFEPTLLPQAGGKSLHDYFARVAKHHRLDFQAVEWTEAEDPGERDDTFYVTHLREPVSILVGIFPCCLCALVCSSSSYRLS